MDIKCNNCKEVKTENDFRYTLKSNNIYFNVNKCKTCLSEGKRTYYGKKAKLVDLTGLNVKTLTVVEEKISYEIEKQLHFLLLRIELNKGNVSEIDCFKILSLYIEIYGENYPKLDKEFEILYCYNKLKQYKWKEEASLI
jgi:hypothetical protein